MAAALHHELQQPAACAARVLQPAVRQPGVADTALGLQCGVVAHGRRRWAGRRAHVVLLAAVPALLLHLLHHLQAQALGFRESGAGVRVAVKAARVVRARLEVGGGAAAHRHAQAARAARLAQLQQRAAHGLVVQQQAKMELHLQGG